MGKGSEGLTFWHKIAVLVVALGEESAGQLMRHFDEDGKKKRGKKKEARYEGTLATGDFTYSLMKSFAFREMLPPVRTRLFVCSVCVS